MIYLILFLFLFFKQSNNICLYDNCAACQGIQSNYFCLACTQGYELIQNGICTQDYTIRNCIMYSQSLDCLVCAPTFQKQINLCTKKYDGCLLEQNNVCKKCIQGSISVKQIQCQITYINCMNIDNNGNCIACFQPYTLVNKKCVDKSPGCYKYNKLTGLCSSCLMNYSMIGYFCLSTLPLNCYLGSDQYGCELCKLGFGRYNSSCITYMQLVKKLSNISKQCQNITYLQANQSLCMNISNCISIDFYTNKCLICSSGYFRSPSGCVKRQDLYCLNFNSNNTCQTCKKQFYMSNSKCQPLPYFCTNYTTQCNECVQGFLLTNEQCKDPNCRNYSLQMLCILCKDGYQINIQMICKYSDVNCRNFNQIGDCILCGTGYFLQQNTCIYKDFNCLTFDNSGVCISCKNQYYFSKQFQICIPLPLNCQSVDISGRCTNCVFSFSLTSNYQCIKIVSIPNCAIINSQKTKQCSVCVGGFYPNKQGICISLPSMCLSFDFSTNVCLQCNRNSSLINGVCMDKNCQLFQQNGQCLYCSPSYTLDISGMCVPSVIDPNCKQFIYGMCKGCNFRYYFNFQFKCVPVSPFCNDYDQNSGWCTSCYKGYVLSDTGMCIINPTELVTQPCKSIVNNNCVACNDGYDTIKINIQPLIVNCVRQISNDTYCLNFSLDKICIKCVSRMYVSNGSCVGIDVNCDQFNASNGNCTVCYSGYVLTPDKNNINSCTIKTSNDTSFCLTKDQNNKCLKCYKGYWLSNSECIQISPLCATASQTNGECLSCYWGYYLNKGICILSS